MADKEKKPDYSAALSALRARRAELEIAIAALERESGMASSASVAPLIDSGDSARASSSDGTIRPDEFFGMSVLDATEKYLTMMKKPQSLGSITGALTQGGLIHQSKNLAATVFTTLRRAEDRGDRVVRFQKQWALGSWYPNRPRPVKEEKPKAKNATKKPAKAPPKAQPKPKLTVAGEEAAKAAAAPTPAPAPDAAQQVAS